MSLWDELPAGARDSGALDALRPALDGVATPASSERAEGAETWRVYTTTLGGATPLGVDLASGAFSRGAQASDAGSTALEFPDPRVGVELGLRLTAPGGAPDGTVRLVVSTPSAALRLPFLRGATLDAQGQLRADPARPVVRFLLPALRVRLLRPAGGALGIDLLSATAGGGAAVDQIFEFVRMEPPHALVGPGNVVGFAFRTAVLDLSGTAGPSGVPAEARAMPGAWQGLYLPEARLFVAPSGMEGLAVSAGVRDLWIGLGRHAGVTGLFEAEVVNRGAAPRVRLRFQSESGEWIGVPDADPATPVALPERTRLYVDAGGGLAPFAYSVTVGGATTSTDRADVVTPAAGTVSISARVTDAGAHVVTRSITVQRRAAVAGAAAPGTQPVSVRPTAGTGSRIVLVSQTGATATVRLDSEGGDVAWSWPGGGAAAGATAEVPLGAGATVTVTATRTRAAGAVLPVDAYFLFDRPEARPTPGETAAYSANPDNVRDRAASSRTGWGTAQPLEGPALTARLAALPAGVTWTVEGWASFEGDDTAGQRARNQALSERRRDGLVALLARNGFAGRVTAGTAHGHDAARDGVSPDGGATPVPNASAWWRARATATLPAGTSETVGAELTRAAAPPPLTDTDPAPTRPPVPDCFRTIGVRVELVRSTFVRAEVYGEFDVQTAAEQRLARSTPGSTLPARTNPQDGVCAFLVRLRVAEDRSSWDVTAEFRAVEGDLDGLAKVERGAGGSQTAIDVLGAVSALAPLLAAATPPSPTAGELVPLVVLSGAAVAIGASGLLSTRYVILRGGELVVADGLTNPADPAGPRTTQVSVLLDVETAFTFDLGFIKVRPDKPIVTRYKAVGVRSTWSSQPAPGGGVEYVPLPVFDPSRGYTLDVPAGSLVAGEPLGDILRVLGVRVSRDNPTYLEAEVGMGVDLGIVTVDTVRVRLRLDAPEVPQLTKLGARMEIPGTLHGTGYVEITADGFKGAFDLTVTPLNVRASAQLAVATRDGVTGVLVGAEVQFPVPLPLGSSGLGLFGFLGGVAVNFRRLEPTGVQAPALRWLEGQLAPARNSVMHPDGWAFEAGSYAFAAGVLLGTAEGGFVVHLKGIVLIEVPGPRLLFVMQADVLKLPPVLKSTQSATFLAVLDLDFARGTITVGVVASYEIASILRVRVPVTAFFDTRQVERWFVDLGTFTEPVTVSVLDVFSGTGYLMVHGNGIVHPRLPLVSSGLTIAVGFSIQAVLMGSKAVGLYLEVAAGFDALVSFEPFGIGGRIYARGELRLFIIGISASAELTVLVGRQLVGGVQVERSYVRGEACGEVDFFFFSVRGCVSLTLGDTPPDEPVAPPLVAGVKLVSRSPALVEGSATDRAVDGVIGDAAAAGTPAPLPSVPLDAVPVVLFATPPSVAAGNVVLGGAPNGASGLPADPWVRRGDRWWRYQVTGVELLGTLQPAPPAGKTPATWWARGMPGDPQHGPALALLSWLPTPASRAVPSGERLDTTVTDRWGRVCGPVAEPAPLLWTFDRQPAGPSAVGWTLAGVAWPDAAGAYRSGPADARLTVTEAWRTGDALVDRLQGTDPARVVGDAVPCAAKKGGTVDGLQPWQAGQPLTFSRATLPTSGAALQDVADLLADGASLGDVAAQWGERNWDRSLSRIRIACDGRVLRSPAGDVPEPAPDGEQGAAGDEERALAKAAWVKAKFKPAELEDAVVVRAAGGLAAMRVLLLVPRRHVERGLVIAFRDAAGARLGARPVNGADLLRPGNALPARWVDPAGPWADPVERAGRLAARVAAVERTLLPVLVALDLPRNTVQLEIGYDRAAAQAPGQYEAFWVVALEGLTAAERRRADWDTTTLSQERSALQTALTQDPDDHALLVPGTAYTVRVRWRGESVKQDDRPAAAAPENFGPEQTQEFLFTADPLALAPKNLAPWVLASAPSMGETGILCQEPVRIAFAHGKVAALFDAYGEELRVLVRSATGRHPEPPGGGGPGAALAIPLAVGGVLKAAPAALRVPTPWQQAVETQLATLPCTPAAGSTTHHTVLEILYTFDPLTDYLLDVIAVPRGAAPNATGRRVFRANFTTSRFDRVEDLARLTTLAVVEHRLVPTPAALAALAAFPPVPDADPLLAAPAGDVLDAAFQAAGLAVPQVPRYPRVQVLWSGDAVPQPVALVVESSEAMWRARPIPTVVPGPSDAYDPGHTWWAAVRKDWLSLARSVAVPAAGDPPAAAVTRLVRGPGGTRALILLGPGARGAEVRLDLVIAADPLAGAAARRAEAVRVPLLHAPWEMED